MGERIRNYNWATSAVGAPENWPYALKTSVSNMLRSGFPMLVLWGKEFTCFYNDPFIPTLGERHPGIGKPASELWKEGWTFIGALLNGVIENGETVSFKDQPVVIHRNGKTEDIYFTFSYSLILDDDGEPGGVLVSCLETTDQVQKRVYETVISATPDLVYVFDLEYKFKYANNALLTMWGKTWETAIGKGLRENGYEEWHAAMHEHEIDQVAATGKSIRGEVSFPHAVLGRRVYDYILVPVFDEKGKVEAVAGTTRDISDIKQADLRIRESEERFRTMSDFSPFYIAVGDESGNATYFNKGWTELTGRPMQELLEFGWADFVHPDDKERYINIYLDALKIKGPFTGEFRVRTPDGQYRWLLAKGSPRFDSDGVFAGYVSACADITQQKQNELAIREKGAALANAIELAELGTWMFEQETGALTLSARYGEMHGLSDTNIRLEEGFANVVDEDREEITRKFEEALRPGSSGRFDGEYRIVNSITNNMHIIHAIGQAFFDEAGKFIRIEGTTQDVTSQRELQLALENEVQNRTMELQAANEELASINEELASTNEELYESSQLLMQSNDELSQFAHVASHDLQEPVRKISVFVEQLERSLGNIDERSKKQLKKIDESANRMLHLIRDILTHSQLSNRGLKFESVDLNKTLQNTLEEFEELIKEKECKIESEMLPVIDAIPIQMSQLFSNLVSNALKFSAPQRQLCLNIYSKRLTESERAGYPRLSRDKTYYRITFSDNGIGFDQSHAVQIFEIFQRLHTRKEYAGTGIGLATCKRIALNHGGHISATSTPGDGATFELVLPATQE
jgi:PAS domain S-box-containing protein